MKPDVFEIYKNGELLNQASDNRDYQKSLEMQILKFSYRTFTQVVLLGSATFTPFMQLSLSQRRQVIEDILDISIFSDMNSVLKARIVVNKDQQVQINHEISIARMEAESHQKMINRIRTGSGSTIDMLKNRVITTSADIDASRALIEEYTSKVESNLSSKLLPDEMTRLRSIRSDLSDSIHSIAQVEKHSDQIHNATVCPTCEQNITEEQNQRLTFRLEAELTRLRSAADALTEEQTKCQDRITVLQAGSAEVATLQRQISQAQFKVSTLTDLITQTQAEIHKLESEQVADLTKETNELRELSRKALDKINRKTELLDENEIQQVAYELLRDSGIKSAIIREYIPVFNHYINKYLTAMDSYFSFELDEEFNEHIKSRYRDDFSYASFSEGEKMRIDLAILFTWRTIAAMKNSVAVNLLITDEIADGSLDSSGLDELMGIFNGMNPDQNVVVISHRGESMYDKFDKVLRAKKDGNFSILEEA